MCEGVGLALGRFQFLGIPPKGELLTERAWIRLGKPFPISRDPPEGGTRSYAYSVVNITRPFPISRDPPEGGTDLLAQVFSSTFGCFQFLGIPPKGEPIELTVHAKRWRLVSNF